MSNPLVEVGPEGEILAISELSEPDRSPLTEFYAGALIPGLVNSHCHLELSYLRGAIPAGGGFAAFADGMGRTRGLFSEEERLRAIAEADATMVSEGVVAVGDVANGNSTRATKAQSPIFYRTFAELFGLRSRDCSAIEPLLEAPHTTPTPHSLYSLQEGPLREVAQRGAPRLSIHFLESEAELELFHREGRLWAWYQTMGFACDFLHYSDPTERLIHTVSPDSSVILVHNCCVEERDIERILNHFRAPVYWCLCPRSNDYISHQKPPVELLRRMGAEICLGTDSLASNHSLSMLEELRAIEGVPLAERLQWATLHGARALGVAEQLGSIEVGKRPGLALLEGLDWSRMELTERTTLRRLL